MLKNKFFMTLFVFSMSFSLNAATYAQTVSELLKYSQWVEKWHNNQLYSSTSSSPVSVTGILSAQNQEIQKQQEQLLAKREAERKEKALAQERKNILLHKNMIYTDYQTHDGKINPPNNRNINENIMKDNIKTKEQ